MLCQLIVLCFLLAVVTSDGYGQKVPEYKPNEKIKDPPTLPAHLLQVILNKDTPVSVSAGLQCQHLWICNFTIIIFL